MIAIIKGEKTRPVLNVSVPEENSFNDNVDIFEVERVHMDTAKTFSYTILRAGKGARLDKTDVKDAFKNVPARIEDLRLHGFKVLDRYFMELRMIFGARTALANYDVLGNTLEKLAIAESGIPRCFVLRAVDDQPVATPRKSDYGHRFVQAYKGICKSINMEIADDCADCEKAFTDKRIGKVLGVWFDSDTLTWKLPSKKNQGTLEKIKNAVQDENVSLVQMQSLMGSLNFLTMMCPFLKSFKFNLNRELSLRIKDEGFTGRLEREAVRELEVFTNILTGDAWLPIALEPTAAPPSAVTFTSDAAGLPNNRRFEAGIGCAAVGVDGAGVRYSRQGWNGWKNSSAPAWTKKW
jgi:hypothetical protein